MNRFTVADLSPAGELILKDGYTYAALEQVPGCAELIGLLSGRIWQAPDEFEVALAHITTSPAAPAEPLLLRWRSTSASSGIMTIRAAGRLCCLSLLACGLDDELDQVTVSAVQRHLVAGLHDSGFEPAFALLDLPERPLVATINIWSPEDAAAKRTIALADRCFAAAYFRYHRLA